MSSSVKLLNLLSCDIHPTAKIMPYTNLYGCTIGKNCIIGPFVEIQKNVIIGDNSRIGSHSFICEGVEIGKNCFIAHGVSFTNDLFDSKEPMTDWILRETKIENNVRIGSNATILPIVIGENSIIGAGAVVTKDVLPNSIVIGNPARITRNREDKK